MRTEIERRPTPSMWYIYIYIIERRPTPSMWCHLGEITLSLSLSLSLTLTLTLPLTRCYLGELTGDEEVGWG